MDFYRTMADLAYEEHVKQNNNVVTEPKDCRHYSVKCVNSEEAKEIGANEEIAKSNQCV